MRSSPARHGEQLFSRDGRTIDEQVAALLRRRARRSRWLSPAPGGLLAARLTERPGSSEYVLGGAVVYSNEAKTILVGG